MPLPVPQLTVWPVVNLDRFVGPDDVTAEELCRRDGEAAQWSGVPRDRGPDFILPEMTRAWLAGWDDRQRRQDDRLRSLEVATEPRASRT